MPISVVIPLYNKAPYIERAIRSVLSQTVLPNEIIVVDDGSTDNGGEIVKSMGALGLRLIRQENQGVSVARNRGIAVAKGELIAFLDADDAWRPRFLEVINYLKKKYGDAGAYGTAYEVIDPLGKKITCRYNALPDGLQDGLIANYPKTGIVIGIAPPIWTSAVVIPKKVFQMVGGFPVGEYRSQDSDTWLRIALRYPIAWTREPLAIWYQNAQNRAYGVKRRKTEPAVSRTVRQALQSGLISKDLKEDLREYGMKYQLLAARDCLELGKRDTARQLLGLARGTRLFAREWWKLRLLATLPVKLVHSLWKIKRWRHRKI